MGTKRSTGSGLLFWVLPLILCSGCSRKDKNARAQVKPQPHKKVVKAPVEVDEASLRRCRTEENRRGRGLSTIGWKGSHRWDDRKKVDLVFLRADGKGGIPVHAAPFSGDVKRRVPSELVARRLEVRVGPKRCWYRIETPDGKTGWISNAHVVGQGGWTRKSCGG